MRRLKMDAREVQSQLCQRFGCEPDYVTDQQMLGASTSFFGSTWPIRGLRHLPSGGTTGWYVWAGEYSDAPDFFKPQHAQHLFDSRSEVIPYLGLPPGWGFIIAPGFEDVWYDEATLVE
jgi:hypothetical protein